MQIQVNSDKSIQVDAEITRFVEAEVNRSLERFASKLTRVEIHLSDVNSGKSGTDDKRCLIEVRPAGQQPLTVTNSAATIEDAVRGALTKLKSALTTSFGKLEKQR